MEAQGECQRVLAQKETAPDPLKDRDRDDRRRSYDAPACEPFFGAAGQGGGFILVCDAQNNFCLTKGLIVTNRRRID
jgi:hypothetical protein